MEKWTTIFWKLFYEEIKEVSTVFNCVDNVIFSVEKNVEDLWICGRIGII